MAKVGLDGHEVGARIIAKALSDSGMEVIYTGLRQTPEMIAVAAIQEAVDIVGISILSGSHLTLLPEIVRAMKDKGASDIPVIAGGVIPVEDFSELKKNGITEVFPPETPTSAVIDYVKELVSKRELLGNASHST
jgi:methylmalonyl-CoA mutase C-terminal domain/subunit